MFWATTSGRIQNFEFHLFPVLLQNPREKNIKLAFMNQFKIILDTLPAVVSTNR